MSLAVAETLLADLDDVLPHAASTRCCIALSAGLDSTVLLSQLVAAREHCPTLELRALHIDHRLHPQSQRWAQSAQAAAQAAGVACEVVEVRIARRSASGLEAAARAARHAVFRAHLCDGEVLVTAHHADDQLETVLLALLRGSGVKGLAAMPLLAPLARGWHWRPLLRFTRAELEACARDADLAWCEDPANLDLRHDRNYLRHMVVPRLRARWPRAAHSAVRASRHLAEAAGLLDAVALADMHTCSVGPCLDTAALSALTPARRRQLLRFWLQSQGLRLPSERRLNAMLRDLLIAAPDRNPIVTWEDGASIRRYGGLLYAVDALGAPPAVDARLELRRDRPLELPGGLGRLRVVVESEDSGGAIARGSGFEVRFRGGGERVRLVGRAHSVSLAELMRSERVLPWMRARVPLVFDRNFLVAIGDVPLAPTAAGGRAPALRWDDQPRWRAPVRPANQP